MPQLSMMLKCSKYSSLFLFALLLMCCGDSEYTVTPDGNQWRLVEFGDQKARLDSAEIIYLDGEIFRNREFYPMRSFYSLPANAGNDALWNVLRTRYTGDSLEYISYTRDFLHPDSLLGDTLHYFLRIDRMRTAIQLSDDRLVELSRLDRLVRTDSVRTLYTEYKDIYFRSLSQPDTTQVRYGREVVLQYRGSTLSGKVFDDSQRMEGPLRFVMGDDRQVIPGIELALEKMHLHETARVVIPSWLAFGARGSAGGRVGGYEPVVYELEVLELGK